MTNRRLNATTVANLKNTINKVGTLEPTTREISTQSGHPPQKLKNLIANNEMNSFANLNAVAKSNLVAGLIASRKPNAFF